MRSIIGVGFGVVVVFRGGGVVVGVVIFRCVFVVVVVGGFGSFRIFQVVGEFGRVDVNDIVIEGGKVRVGRENRLEVIFVVVVLGYEIFVVVGVVVVQVGRSVERVRVVSLGVVDGIGLDFGVGGGERGEEVEGSGFVSFGIRVVVVGLMGLEGFEVVFEDGGSVENVVSEG